MRALRGATTVSANTEEAIRWGALELWDALVESNRLDLGEIISLTFTCTRDLDAAYPGKFIRLERGLTEAAIMHMNEMAVKGALPKCLRIMILMDRPNDSTLTPVYLHQAADLRPDLKRP